MNNELPLIQEDIVLDGGVKHDDGKLRYDLVAPDALEGLVGILTHGATKYEARNWEQGLMYTRVYGALMRHLQAWMRGERVDPESGLLTIDHVQACAHFLSAYEHRMLDEFDDRPVFDNMERHTASAQELPPAS